MLEKVTKKSACKLLSQIESTNENTFLFWDTCSLLDIIRLPFRTNSKKFLDFYQQIKGLIENKKILSVASEMTIAELNYNTRKVEIEYDNYLRKLQRELDLHEDYLMQSENICEPILSFNLEEKGLKQYLITLLYDIVSNTVFISENQSYNKFAHFRVSYHMAPAQRKGEYKDCYIWSTCLKLAKLASNHDKIYFFTSNKDDFFENGNLFELIENDCKNTTISIKHEIGELLGELMRK